MPSNKPKTIVVTFKRTEEQLYSDIIKSCEFIKYSDWMKIAAREKLERDNLKNQSTMPRVNQSITEFTSKPFTSVDQLFN
jgi:hypothetical protein